MNKKSVITVVVGAIVAFAWSTISWMALGWHMTDFKQFKNDTMVMDVIREQAQGSGFYMLPNMDPSIHEDKEREKEWFEKAQRGPYAFISARVDGVSCSMARSMTVGLLINLLTAIIFYGLLRQTKLKKDKEKVLFVAFAAVAGSLIPYLGNWAWWHFPLLSMAINVVDTFVMWGLAGLAMVKISKKIG